MEWRNRLYAKLILMCCCLLSLLFTEADAAFILALFIAAGLTFFAEILTDKRLLYLLFLLYAAGICFLPALLFFLPLICFDAAGKDTLPALIFPAAAAAVFSKDVSVLLFVTVICAAGIYIGRLLEKTERLERETYAMQDAAVSREMVSEREYTALQEKQDMELISATYAERNRIAREIHDNVGHLLSRAILLNGAMKTVCKEEQLLTPLTQMDETLHEAMESVRKSVHDLHDEALDLKAETEKIAAAYTFCPIRVDYRMGNDIPREVRFCMLQVLKEALSNTAKHSDATMIDVSMIEHPGFYRMRIADNGSGNNAADTDFASVSGNGNMSSGIGLSNMKARVRALNGSIQFSADNGFRIHMTIPKEVEESA